MRSASSSSLLRWMGWLGCALVLVLMALVKRLPPDGRDHAALARFVGRFHPILVHLPIGLLVVVPLLELAGAFGQRNDLRRAAGFVLGLATIGALAAALDGWLLAWSDGYGGPLVLRHMWGGTALAMLCLLTAWIRTIFARDQSVWPGFVFIYGPLLAGCVVLMAWTSHQGGKITHGDSFLTAYMPDRLRGWLGVAAVPPPKPAVVATAMKADTVYTARVAPIFERSCVQCHNPNKIKGGLRLDSYEQLMRGGENGAEIVPWLPADSELVRRITLPVDDDDHMPSNGKNPLTADEIALLERWIAAGASNVQPLASLKP